MTFDQKIKELNINLPEAAAPVGSYVAAKISGKTVSFTGRVKVPGFHVITPYVDPLTALIYAGGVDTIGSLREVVFFRNNTPLDTLDLYAFLLDGAPSSSHFMRDGDRLHIPNRFSTVTVSGAVEHPGYFELKPNESLGQALRYAGGLKVSASQMIHLRRLSNSITENRYNNYSSLYVRTRNYWKFHAERRHNGNRQN